MFGSDISKLYKLDDIDFGAEETKESTLGVKQIV